MILQRIAYCCCYIDLCHSYIDWFFFLLIIDSICLEMANNKRKTIFLKAFSIVWCFMFSVSHTRKYFCMNTKCCYFPLFLSYICSAIFCFFFIFMYFFSSLFLFLFFYLFDAHKHIRITISFFSVWLFGAVCDAQQQKLHYYKEKLKEKQKEREGTMRKQKKSAGARVIIVWRTKQCEKAKNHSIALFNVVMRREALEYIGTYIRTSCIRILSISRVKMSLSKG